jgi:hypothetical protein
VTLTVQDLVVRLTDDPGQARGINVAFDNRHRVQVPFGLRAIVGFHPGVRVLVVALPHDGSLAVLPVGHVLTSFARPR